MPETSPARQLAAFIARFDPAMARRIRECRAALRRRFPAANELVYDNYKFAIGYSTTERPSDCVASLTANAKGVGLSFYYGSTLPDPQKIKQGSGSQSRFIWLDASETLNMPAVEEMLAAAAAQADPPFPESGGGKLIIRSISEKQRRRR